MAEQADSLPIVLDACVLALKQGKSREECLAAYPQFRAELEPLLILTGRLEAARSEITTPTALRQSGAERVRQYAAAHPQAATVPIQSRREVTRAESGKPRLGKANGWQLAARWAVALLVLAAALAGSASAAAAHALPGDWLYPVKTTQENLQLSLTSDPAAQADLRLKIASRRLDEAGQLLASGRTGDLPQAMVGYALQVQAGLSSLETNRTLSAGEQSRLADHLAGAVEGQETQLQALIFKAPENARGPLQQALTASKAVRDSARKLQRNEGGLNKPPALPAANPQPASAATPTPGIRKLQEAGGNPVRQAAAETATPPASNPGNGLPEPPPIPAEVTPGATQPAGAPGGLPVSSTPDPTGSKATLPPWMARKTPPATRTISTSPQPARPKKTIPPRPTHDPTRIWHPPATRRPAPAITRIPKTPHHVAIPPVARPAENPSLPPPGPPPK